MGEKPYDMEKLFYVFPETSTTNRCSAAFFVLLFKSTKSFRASYLHMNFIQ